MDHLGIFFFGGGRCLLVCLLFVQSGSSQNCYQQGEEGKNKALHRALPSLAFSHSPVLRQLWVRQRTDKLIPGWLSMVELPCWSGKDSFRVVLATLWLEVRSQPMPSWPQTPGWTLNMYSNSRVGQPSPCHMVDDVYVLCGSLGGVSSVSLCSPYSLD